MPPKYTAEHNDYIKRQAIKYNLKSGAAVIQDEQINARERIAANFTRCTEIIAIKTLRATLDKHDQILAAAKARQEVEEQKRAEEKKLRAASTERQKKQHNQTAEVAEMIAALLQESENKRNQSSKPALMNNSVSFQEMLANETKERNSIIEKELKEKPRQTSKNFTVSDRPRNAR